MTTILDINKPVDSKHVLWEHLIKSVVAFVGTYSFLIFGPLLISGKSHTRQHNGDSIAMEFLKFILENPAVVYCFCGIIVIAFNIFIFFKNAKIKYVTKIMQENENLIFTKTNLKCGKTSEVVIPINQLHYVIESKMVDEIDKKQKLKFINSKTGTIIGEIIPKHIIWYNQIVKIKEALSLLSNLGVSKQISESKKDSFATSLFK